MVARRSSSSGQLITRVPVSAMAKSATVKPISTPLRWARMPERMQVKPFAAQRVEQPGILDRIEAGGRHDFFLLEVAEGVRRRGKLFLAAGDGNPAGALPAAEIEAIGHGLLEIADLMDDGRHGPGLFAEAGRELVLPVLYGSC